MLTCDKGTFVTFTAHWKCGQAVKMFGATSFLQTHLNTPVTNWQGAISATGYNSLPSFETTQVSTQASANVVGVTGGVEFCGGWSPGVDTIPSTNTLVVYNETHSPCASSANRGSIGDLLTHEMAHVWGWAGGDNTGHNGGIAGVSDHCTLALPASGLNATICAHNIEGGIAGYGLRSLPTQNFWSTPFVTGHNGPGSYSPISLQDGNSHGLTLGSFVKERGGTVTGSWHSFSSDTDVATVSGGTITAVDSGTATITIVPNAGSGYFLTSAFAASSRTVQVTVTPQPLAALVVQNITINTTLPITSPSTHTWTAVLGSGDASGLTFRWVFEYSDNSPPDSVFIPARLSGDTVPPWLKTVHPDTAFVGVGSMVSQPVHAGDYTIWVKVWPVRNGIAGSPAAREYSVCTSVGGGGGGEALHAGLTDRTKVVPPPENEAVEGCA